MSPRAAIDAVVARIVQQLRQPGALRIRHQPHRAMPFHVEPFSFMVSHETSNTGEIVFGARWLPFADPGTGIVGNVATERTGAEEWPKGFVGVVTVATCAVGVIQPPAMLSHPARQFRWTLFLNGAGVPGLTSVPASHAAGTWRSSPLTHAMLTPTVGLPHPVLLWPGDRLHLVWRSMAVPIPPGGGELLPTQLDINLVRREGSLQQLDLSILRKLTLQQLDMVPPPKPQLLLDGEVVTFSSVLHVAGYSVPLHGDHSLASILNP